MSDRNFAGTFCRRGVRDGDGTVVRCAGAIFARYCTMVNSFKIARAFNSVSASARAVGRSSFTDANGADKSSAAGVALALASEVSFAIAHNAARMPPASFSPTRFLCLVWYAQIVLAAAAAASALMAGLSAWGAEMSFAQLALQGPGVEPWAAFAAAAAAVVAAAAFVDVIIFAGAAITAAGALGSHVVWGVVAGIAAFGPVVAAIECLLRVGFGFAVSDDAIVPAGAGCDAAAVDSGCEGVAATLRATFLAGAVAVTASCIVLSADAALASPTVQAWLAGRSLLPWWLPALQRLRARSSAHLGAAIELIDDADALMIALRAAGVVAEPCYGAMGADPRDSCRRLAAEGLINWAFFAPFEFLATVAGGEGEEGGGPLKARELFTVGLTVVHSLDAAHMPLAAPAISSLCLARPGGPWLLVPSRSVKVAAAAARAARADVFDADADAYTYDGEGEGDSEGNGNDNGDALEDGETGGETGGGATPPAAGSPARRRRHRRRRAGTRAAV